MSKPPDEQDPLFLKILFCGSLGDLDACCFLFGTHGLCLGWRPNGLGDGQAGLPGGQRILKTRGAVLALSERRERVAEQFVGLLGGGDLRPGGLAEKVVGLIEVAGFDGGVGLGDQGLCSRVVGIQGGGLFLEAFVVGGDFGEQVCQFFVRDVGLLADDPQQGFGGLLGDAEFAAEGLEAVEEWSGGAGNGRLSVLSVARGSGRNCR